MMAPVANNSAISEVFTVINGVEQGFVLAPTLVSLMFSTILMEAYRYEIAGIRITYRTDDIFSAAGAIRPELSDDCALNTATEVDMQRGMDALAAGCAKGDMIINTDKTVVMHQPLPNTQHFTPPRNTEDGCQLKAIDKFTNLGSTVSNSIRLGDEVANRISKADQAFGRLQKSVWNRHGLQLNTELEMYQAVIMTTLL
ncbi:hypothetical protein SprV_0501960800 [Sparganum proliferum]